MKVLKSMGFKHCIEHQFPQLADPHYISIISAELGQDTCSYQLAFIDVNLKFVSQFADSMTNLSFALLNYNLRITV